LKKGGKDTKTKKKKAFKHLKKEKVNTGGKLSVRQKGCFEGEKKSSESPEGNPARKR